MLVNTALGKMNLAARNELHLMRKAFHTCMGLSFFYLYWTFSWKPSQGAEFLFALTFLSLLGELARLHSPFLNKVTFSFLGPFMRASEKDSLSGFPYYTLGGAISLAFFQEDIALLSLLFLVFSDPISSFIGIKFGSFKLRKNKSLQGSLAGFCTCYLIAMVYGLIQAEASLDLFFFSLFAGFVGAMAEFFAFLDDNLTLPLLSAIGLTALNFFFHLF